jgi:RimJ/RimL family protein N-acetyltransferase
LRGGGLGRPRNLTESKEIALRLTPTLLRAGKAALKPLATGGVTIHLGPRGLRPFSIDVKGPAREWLRPLVPDDRELLEQFFRGLSEHSFKVRFPGVPEAKTPEVRAQQCKALAKDFLEKSQVQGHASFVVKDGAGNVVALLDYKPHKALRGMCEVDMVVADTLNGQGLGSALLRQAKVSAFQAGYSTMRAVVATGNTGMRNVLSNAGIDVWNSGYANLLAPGHTSYDIDLRAPEKPPFTPEQTKEQRDTAFIRTVQRTLDAWFYQHKHLSELGKLGTYSDEGSGKLTEKTHKALKTFQQQENIEPADGQLNQVTLQKLGIDGRFYGFGQADGPQTS